MSARPPGRCATEASSRTGVDLASRGEGSVLSVEGISKRFGPIEVLKNVSLAIDRSEIRALCGENGAGKSTLVKILTGVYAADEGSVVMDGEIREIRNPRRAQELGIALVSQELSLAPHLSIEDNIWLGNRTVPFFHRRRGLRKRAQEALEQVGLGALRLDTTVAHLGVGQRQLVEIARMLTRDARVLILDEPTATLSDAEIERIFTALRALRDNGKSIIYITHRLGEVFEICDTASVLRNGEHVGTRRTAEIDRETLIGMMLGRSIGDMYPHWESTRGKPMFDVRGLHVPGIVRGLDFVVEGGTVLCIAGEIGSGATETLRALTGLVSDATADVSVDSVPYRLRSVVRARAAKVAFISEDRAAEGIFLRLLVGQNLVATRLRNFTRLGFLNHRRLRAEEKTLAAAVKVDETRLRSRADELSGGNQQKLAFGRSIQRARPGVLLMNEPTRGVDVGARAEIYRLMREFCDLGYAVVMASTDLEEVIGMADVIITLYRGKQVGRYRREEATLAQILADITHLHK